MKCKLVHTDLYHVSSVLSPATVERCQIADLDPVPYLFTCLDPDRRRRVLVPNTPWLHAVLDETYQSARPFVLSHRPEFTRMLAVVWHDTTGFRTPRHEDAAGERAVLQLYIRSAQAGTRFYLPSGTEYTVPYEPNSGYLHFNSGLQHELAGVITPADTRISVYAYFIQETADWLIRKFYETYGCAVYDRSD